MTAISIITLAFSFVHESVFAYFFGASNLTDAYTIATQIPVTLFALVATAIGNVVIPCYSKEYYSSGPEAAEKYVCNLSTLIALVSLGFVLFCEIFAYPIISLFAPGMDAQTKLLAVSLFRVVLPTILFTGLMHINTGILNVHKKFVLPALSSVLLNLIFILSVAFLAAKFGIFAAVIGTLVGTSLQFLYSVILRRKIMKYHFVFDLKNRSMVQSFRMSVPVFVGIGAAEINKVVDRKLQEINNEYESKRASFRLKLPQAHILSTNAYARFKKSMLNDGWRDGQFKFNLLMQDEMRRRKFDQIERQDSLSDIIMELADNIDTRIKGRQKARAQRRTDRATKRTKKE